jgi:hypothetical protein
MTLPTRAIVQLKDLYTRDAISLDLSATTKDAVLAELIGLLRVDARSSETLLRVLQRH